MCIFSRAVKFVGQTRIFARTSGDRQLLAYAMNVELAADVAMVLPLPVALGAAEDAVRFVDLEGYENFFDDLERAFPTSVVAAQSLGFSRDAAVSRATLAVHQVGRFVASFVPTRGDFARLDARFRLSDDVWSRLPDYADWGFAVFQLAPSAKRQRVHPMALSFPTRAPRAIFFPTVHVHDGHVAREAKFDHQLYAQADGVLEALLTWTRSQAPLGAHVDAPRAKDVVDGARRGFTRALRDVLPNADTWLREPEGVALEDLEARGELFAFRAGAYFAFEDGPVPPNIAQWRDTARTRLGPLCRGVRSGLDALCAAKKSAWRLAPLTPDLPRHFMNGRQLWMGTEYTRGAPPTTRGGRGMIHFTPFTDRVHTQHVELGFEEMPEDDRVREIVAELSALLDRSAFGA